jgi:macrolide-specific efflux system membrane fusion protein
VKKKWYIIFGSLITIVVLYFIVNSFFSNTNEKSDNFKSAVVTRRDIGSSVLSTGIIKPMVGAEVRVGSRVSGLVKSLHANVGDYVKKGQIIAELEPSELEAKYNQSLAALNNTKANYEYAKLDLERQKSLLKQNFISQNQLDLAEKTFEINKAQLEQAQANLDFAKVQLEYTKITAPISGIVASVSTQEGETVAASFSAPTFVTIIDLERLEVWAYVDETDIGRIKESQNATFTVDTYSDTDFEGIVTAIYPKAVILDNVVNYVATLKITDFKEKILRPEMTVTVTIYLEKKENVLTVPNNAIKREQGKTVVTVLDKNGKMDQRIIKTGYSSNGYVEILDGVRESEKVVL